MYNVQLVHFMIEFKAQTTTELNFYFIFFSIHRFQKDLKSFFFLRRPFFLLGLSIHNFVCVMPRTVGENMKAPNFCGKIRKKYLMQIIFLRFHVYSPNDVSPNNVSPKMQ
jgi:hypothetical protein